MSQLKETDFNRHLGTIYTIIPCPIIHVHVCNFPTRCLCSSYFLTVVVSTDVVAPSSDQM